MRPPAQSRFIPTLDGWRALAVVMVIICHECLEHNPGFAWMAPLGAVGVRIFFGISGYLICTLLLIEREATSRISLKNFYVRRVFRILPPALAYLSFLVLATMLGWNLINRSSILACIFLMANNLSVGYFVNHFWSLSLEEQFYLLWPALLVYAGKVRSARFAAIALILVPLWRFLYTWVHHAPAPANRSDMTL
ncbi:MAG: acyltransferase, partial [Acidobacteriaceae bacterium]|nr:acyltransferase [Acidobacteriaceae bacterium]